jgi:hypothetical protein
MRTSVTDRNNALQLMADRCNGGYMRLYTGARPASPDDALGAAVLFAQCLLNNPAFGSAQGGLIVANVISAGTVLVDGSPTFARFFRADGTTAVVDMLVPEEITLSKTDWTAGEPFAGPSITWSQAAE